MSARMRRGLIVAILHLAIVASLGGKLLFDRATRPRVWARAAPFDPTLPIRGRYVRLGLEVAIDPRLRLPEAPEPVSLVVRDNMLWATVPSSSSRLSAHAETRRGEQFAVLDEGIAYFIPERAVDPSRRPDGEELWVEVTVPRAGLPRPIQLGIKRNGTITPWTP